MLKLALLLVAVASVAAVSVSECGDGKGLHKNAADISISSCDGPTYCKLKRRSEINLEIKFKPEEDIESLTNNVYARLLGIPFPFIGVDGTSACSSMFNADGSKASCPLKAKQDYVYKNSFKVLEIYPKVRVQVQWRLVYGGGKSVVCFEIPARITS